MKDNMYASAIESLNEASQQSYKNLDLDRLLIYSMGVLEKKNVPLYYDYISVAAFRLFPSRFSMANFKEYPDTNRISKALRRLTDQTRKNWATGTIEHGFHISEAGKEAYAQVDILLKSPEPIEAKNVGKRTRGRSTTDDANEILKSELYKKWTNNKEGISEFEVTNFLGATPYTPKSLLLNHMIHLKRSVESTDSSSAAEFLNWLENEFGHLFQD